MATTRLPDRTWVLTCSHCGATSTPARTGRETRSIAKADGWARSYPRGMGEDFYCPTDRRRGGTLYKDRPRNVTTT